MALMTNQENGLFKPLNACLTSRLRPPRASALIATLLMNSPRFWSLAPVGFREDAVSTEQLDLIADAAADDARVGIEMLRVAARRAMKSS